MNTSWRIARRSEWGGSSKRLSGKSKRQEAGCQACFLAWMNYCESLTLLSIGLKDTLLSKPSPSDYAKTWVDCQEKTHPILCIRPVACCGLPIFLLHPVFATYLSLSKKPLISPPRRWLRYTELPVSRLRECDRHMTPGGWVDDNVPL